MKKLNYILTITATLTALAVQTSSAQPTGSITSNPITDPANRLWDCSLLTNWLQNVHLDIQNKSDTTADVTYSGPFVQNGAGKLVGSGTNVPVQLIVDHNGPETNTFTGKYTTSGAISGGKGVTKVSFLTKVSGKTTFSGDTKATAVSASANYVATVKSDATTNLLSVKSIEHATAAGKGSLSEVKLLDPVALPADLGDGSWTLVLNFGAPTNKLSGTASVTLATGEVYPFNFTGTFVPKTQQSKLNLKGVDLAKGSSLQVMLLTNEVTKITGKVSGQSVNIKYSTLPTSPRFRTPEAGFLFLLLVLDNGPNLRLIAPSSS